MMLNLQTVQGSLDVVLNAAICELAERLVRFRAPHSGGTIYVNMLGSNLSHLIWKVH